mmetsp:Transcript_19028/g.18288  ORF Transcript_19028/g.18288 Transcript_19028/m.18288 type:complete len:190 (-) Transcript_19028:12-581(-)|eukprot:CAMPEP_0197835768 /NCGR_PEP_ID=MMETSP1437-20131217/26881_1 /TAXON_ID=49252 ORGANISM="Eucampia antarctica, Strain CCMP1452" /NCGR_SAMPLE_ID=MMETSP1437 /ASSEMBLY_ACC=CAM_ASM_001096 /LENGTH=189 /DNA_ID=CAMNT_0043441445 /DNA_START=32 /DNA_END=601 /DNA_ORIENTATION=+
MRVVIIPGMGCTPVQSSVWYSWFAKQMESRPAVTECVIRNFPDPYVCKESVWVPFLTNEIGLDQDTIVVGHSTGAACAMRLLESDDIAFLRGVVLVAAAHTDLGEESERKSEYFNRPWNWEKMKQGAQKIVCFHGTDDPLIPVSEARHIAQKMECDAFEYKEMDGMSHFFHPWQDILDVLDNIIETSQT